MINSNACAALKQVAASLLGMGQTRLELASIELTQALQATVRTVIWSLLAAVSAAFASLFVCILLIVLAWETHRFIAITGCVAFYVLLAGYCYFRLPDQFSSNKCLFQATIAELGRDKQAILSVLSDDRPTQS